MSDVKQLVASIIHFLGDQMQTGGLSPDAIESLEVAVQCLESAYNISSGDETLRPNSSLLDLFRDHVNVGVTDSQDELDLPPEATPENKAEADRLKIEGNTLTREEKFQEAIDCYTRAIALDGRNAIFYGNRAAAHSKLGNYQQAISDCQLALKIDPSYSKAYARLGLAYSNLGCNEEASVAYAKALELEPDNESYKNNLKLAQEKLTSQLLTGSGVSNLGSMNSIFGNSELMNVASQVLSDPSMQNMLSNLVTGNNQQSGSPMDALIRAGQQFAQHLQSANPQLVEQLRRQFEAQNHQSNGNSNGSTEPPPPAP